MGLIFIPKAVAPLLLSVKTVKSIKIALWIFKEYVVEEEDLQKLVNLKGSALSKRIIELIDLNLIERLRNKDGEIVYIINPTNFSDIRKKCNSCKAKKKIKNIDGKKIRYYYCEDESCTYHKVLDYLNMIKVLKVDYKIALPELYNLKKSKEEFDKMPDKDIDSWNSRDFARFVMSLLKEYYSDYPRDKSVYSRILKDSKRICKYVKKLNEERWRKLLKCYFYTVFARLSREDKRVNIKYLFDEISVSKELKGITNELKELNYCRMKKMYCKYMGDNGECVLIRDNQKCTRKIRDHMMRRYN